MSVPQKLAGFAVVLAVSFVASFGLGRAVGPIGDDPAPRPSAEAKPHGSDDGEHEGSHP